MDAGDDEVEIHSENNETHSARYAHLMQVDKVLVRQEQEEPERSGLEWGIVHLRDVANDHLRVDEAVEGSYQQVGVGWVVPGPFRSEEDEEAAVELDDGEERGKRLEVALFGLCERTVHVDADKYHSTMKNIKQILCT